MASISSTAISSSYEPYALAIPRRWPACVALLRSLEAMAEISDQWPRCIAGMTFSMPMAAVLRIPQRTLRFICLSDFALAFTAPPRRQRQDATPLQIDSQESGLIVAQSESYAQA